MDLLCTLLTFYASTVIAEQDTLDAEIILESEYTRDSIANGSIRISTNPTPFQITDDRYETLTRESNLHATHSSSSSTTQIYIIVVIESTVITISSPNRREVREFRYSYKHSESDEKVQNAGKECDYNSGSGLFIRKRRVYSIEYPRKNLELLNVLGEGNFGLVWKAKVNGIKETGIVAVKTAKVLTIKFFNFIEKADSSENEWNDLLRELNIMLQLGQHPNVVRILGCCTEMVPYYLIMEYVENGKLLTFLRNYRSKKDYYNESESYVTTSDLLSFAYHCAKGMEFICSYGDEDVYEQKTKGAMPIRWMAPESLNLNQFTTKTDIWSFGILFWEIVTLGSTPYPGLGASDVIKNVREGYIMEKPDVVWCTDACYDLMKNCWNINPKKRPTFSEIKQTIFNMLEKRREFIDLTSFADNLYYGILYKSQGEKV
ncbi:cadherin 96Ca-like protein [Dinothrombium tinctorium]|uniref:Cadherin 96Ca-like protein n=1 Tax=Dinothrombium tinctorium TaxID=1965070 RepID=A0A3S3PNT6_9ACAR|nr:cadherin 96Ca-like protein [Dinothrombium tinctorium]